MATTPIASLESEARAVLVRLFDIAAERLRERGVSMEYDAAVVALLLGQSGWRESPNPLLSLSGDWHRQVADVIEALLLDGSLTDGGVVVVENVEQNCRVRLGL
jgi:hypothetical protein